MDYKITISLSDPTLKKLHNQGFWLRAYKGGITSELTAVVNTVWYTTNEFSSQMLIDWDSQNYGFFSFDTDLKKGKLIQARLYEMEAGQTMTINPDGSIRMSTYGTANLFTFHNINGNELATGLGQNIAKKQNVFCVQPTDNKDTTLIGQKEKILLVFESEKIEENKIVTRTLNPSILVSLCPDQNSRVISYDFENSWDAKGEIWAKIFDDPVVIKDKLWSNYVPFLKWWEKFYKWIGWMMA